MHELCEFSVWFSMLVARELEDARLLKHQFRETTWTDRMLLEIKRLRDPRIIAAKSNELVTGADMDWWFVKGTTAFCLRVQAKILHYEQHNATLWHYEDIAHPRDNPGLQSRTLVGHARSAGRAGTPHYPLYLFYNPMGVGAPRYRATPPAFNGATIMDGYIAAAHIAANVSGKMFPIAAKRYTALSSMMFSLHDIFCSGPGAIPGPTDVARRLDLLWDRLKDGEAIPGGASRLKPALVQNIPPQIRHLVELAGFRDDPGDLRLARDTIIFLAGD